MATAVPTRTGFGARFFPPEGAPESELLEYRDRVINRWSLYRNQHMGRIGLAMSYFLGDQWAQLDTAAAFDGVRGVVLRTALDDDVDSIVRPVTNEIDPAVEQEVIALVKRRWTPKNTPTNNDPRIKAAAQVSNDIVNYRLEQLSWPEKRHQTGLIFATGGTSHIYTGWDKSYAELKPIGAPDAVWCSECGTKLFSDEVPVDALRQGVAQEGGGYSPVSNLSAAKPIPPHAGQTDVEMAQLPYCPTCPEPHALAPVPPSGPGAITEDEAREGTDVFGRALGVDAPRGASTVEIDVPWEHHPENGGFKITPDTCRRRGRRKIRSLEWLEERYPHLVDEIAADPITELLYGDPLIGSWENLGRWSASLDAGILDNHANVDELIELPSFRHPDGRYVVCTRDKVLEDSPLLESAELENAQGEMETVSVPRVQISGARFKLRPQDYWGTTLADNEISKQNRLNGIDSQLIEGRLRMGNPNQWMPADMWPGDDGIMEYAGGGGKIFLLKQSLTNPQARPEAFGGELMSDSVYMERDRVQADIKKGIGPQDPTMGMAPKNVGTTSGLQLLIEQDERSRSLREDELVTSAEKSWSHLVRLEWVLRVDEDVYRVLGPNKTWKYQQYRGNALRGQTEVKIERGAFIAKSVVQREGAREAIADGLVSIENPVDRRRLREIYGIDSDINEDTNNQVDHAERLWVEFVDKHRVRVADEIDEPMIHYKVLTTHLRSDEGEKLADEANWDEIARKTAGWMDEYTQLVVLEAKAIAFYGGRLTGDEAKEAFAKATVAFQKKQDLYDKQLKVYGAIASGPQGGPSPGGGPGGAGGPAPVSPINPALSQPPIAPEPPPMPVEVPVLLQDRILTLWLGMLKKLGPEGEALVAPPQAPAAEFQPDPMIYVKMRALTAGYKISLGLAAAGAAPGMPPMAAAAGAAGPGQQAGGGAGPRDGAGQPATAKPTASGPGGGKR